MAGRHAAALGRLAELALELAGDLQAAALAAEDASDKAALAGAFHRIARTARQSIALEARLARDAERGRFEAWERGETARKAEVETRRTRVRLAVERLIWTEHEPDEAEVLAAEFADRLEEDALAESFLDEPLEAQVTRLSAELGLTRAGAVPYLPRALRPPLPEAPPWIRPIGLADPPPTPPKPTYRFADTS